MATHRLLPSVSAPPISSLSPSEMNFEFVKAGLSVWPVFTWMGYASLVSVVLLHGAEGASVVLRYFTGYAPSKWLRRTIAAAVAFSVFFGLYRISQEPLHLRGAQLERVKAVYAMIPPYAYFL